MGVTRGVLAPIGKRKGERQFLQELKNSIRNRGYWHKIADSFPEDNRMLCGACRKKKEMTMRYIPKKPFDAFMVIDGRSFYIEAKFHPFMSRAWPFADVREHQEENLLQAHRAGAAAGILLNVREGLGSRRYNRTFCIGIEQFIKAKESGAKSMRPEEMQGMFFEMKWQTPDWVFDSGDLEMNLRSDGMAHESQGILLPTIHHGVVK